MKTNKHLIPKMLADGWTLAQLKQYFWILDDWTALAEVNRLQKEQSK